MSRNPRSTFGVVAAATVLALVGATSLDAGDSHRRNNRVKFKGAWIFQSIEYQSPPTPNPDRCGEGVELHYTVRGVDTLGGIFIGEVDQCFANTETGQKTFDTRVTQTYQNGDTAEIACEPQSGIRNDEECNQDWRPARCTLLDGTGGLNGIRGYAVIKGIESGSDCDGSTMPNSNDAGAMWTKGAAYLPRRR